jgi:putative transposase
MPRMAREKTYDAIYHTMSRSISEVDLFKDDEDKKTYLSLVKKYQKHHEFRVYGYCLMRNHVHFIIDANGTDISKVMHGINFSYAQYFNRKHKRHGHLFQDRFKSKIVVDQKYLITLSAYIHNNPIDMPEYELCPEKYEYSTLAVYLGQRQDPYELVDDGFIMSLFGKSSKTAREKYLKFVLMSSDSSLEYDVEFENEGTEYKSERKILVRDFSAEKIMEFIASKVNVSRTKLYAKHSRKLTEAKALAVLLMRSLCNFKCSEICCILGNITQGRVSKLSSIGIDLIDRDERFKRILYEFIECYGA